MFAAGKRTAQIKAIGMSDFIWLTLQSADALAVGCIDLLALLLTNLNDVFKGIETFRNESFMMNETVHSPN